MKTLDRTIGGRRTATVGIALLPTSVTGFLMDTRSKRRIVDAIDVNSSFQSRSSSIVDLIGLATEFKR